MPQWPVALRAAAFLSGAAALVFETLWFRQAGLLLGNAVWSSSIVLASFMAGLAIGNGVAGRWGGRLRRPLRAYGALELLVGGAGVALVVGLPPLVPLIMPALRTLTAEASLNGVRTVLAFVLLVVPASAMGATLPVLVKALSRPGSRFGWTLGQLYGWNTLGAVAGALSGEGFLIALLGVRGTALAALALNATAAAIAWLLDHAGKVPVGESTGSTASGVTTPWAALFAAFLAGGILLSLEVVWFRFLLLTVVGTSRAFAAMLGVVLLGIAAGGLIASRWTRIRPAPPQALVALALVAGAVTLLSYARFEYALRFFEGGAAITTGQVIALAVPLMLPTCVVSGLLFTLIGDAVRQQADDDARATGLVTLANTLGALLGALVGGFALLPGLGVERSVYVLSLAYLGVGLGVLPAARSAGSTARHRLWMAAGAALYVLALATFPFGVMGRRYLRAAIVRWVDLRLPDTEVVAVREGLTETAMVTRWSRWDTPITYRLITNAISMSAWDQVTCRYMRAFVYLPMALNPEARRALLISYGVGVTAKALTDTASLQSIDVVDVSRDIVRATRVVYPVAGQHPLDDPRVRLHIEDGRFYLASRTDTYDIITGEPPPPTAAGISTLYSKEYFQLLRSRLAEGGVASYWLPVHQMRERDSQAITAAFCAAFPDCSLWQGWAPQWILIGTRNARPRDEAAFARQWEDPRLRWELEAMALEKPELLGTLFLGDAADLAEWTRGVAPVDDDHPHRITPQVVQLAEPYFAFADPLRSRERFAGSDFIRRLWPSGLRARTIDAFAGQSPVLRLGWRVHGIAPPGLRDLHAVLTGSSQRTPVLWLMGADALLEQAGRAARARGIDEPGLDEVLGISEMADRNYRAAEALFARAQPHAASPNRLLQWRVLALCLAGEKDAAAELMRQSAGKLPVENRDGWLWLSDAFALPAAIGLAQAAP